VERAFHQVTAYADQCPEQRQIVDLLREVPRPDHGRARSSQLRQIRDAANLFYILVRLEQWTQSYRICDPVPIRHFQDGLVDAPMQRFEEMIRPELQLDVLDQPI